MSYAHLSDVDLRRQFDQAAARFDQARKAGVCGDGCLEEMGVLECEMLRRQQIAEKLALKSNRLRLSILLNLPDDKYVRASGQSADLAWLARHGLVEIRRSPLLSDRRVCREWRRTPDGKRFAAISMELWV